MSRLERLNVFFCQHSFLKIVDIVNNIMNEKSECK